MLKRIGGRQGGGVLVVSLIILVVMTLLVLGMLRTAVLELKIGGTSQQAELNFSNAESMLAKYVNENNGRFSSNCLNVAGTSSCFATTDGATTIVGTAPNQTMTKVLEGSTVTLSAQQIGCTDDAGVGSGSQLGPGGLQAVYLDIQAVATGDFAGRATVHQGIKSHVPPGGCN